MMIVKIHVTDKGAVSFVGENPKDRIAKQCISDKNALKIKENKIWKNLTDEQKEPYKIELIKLNEKRIFEKQIPKIDDIVSDANPNTYNQINKNNASSGKIISDDEYALFISLKSALTENSDLNLDIYRENKEREIEEELNLTKMIKEEDLDKKFILKEKEFEENLNKEYKELLELISNAKVEKDNLEKEAKILKELNAKVLADQSAIISDSNDQSKRIIARAEKEAKLAAEEAAKLVNENYEKKIASKEIELENRELVIAQKEAEFDAKGKVIKIRETSLSKKEEIYLEASPDRVLSLESEIVQKKGYIEELRADYLVLQDSINETLTLKLKANGRSLEELLRENEQLLSQISSLEDKCNRFTAFELSEMKRALDVEPDMQKVIDERTREVREKTSELNRLKNNVMEIEQLKAQMDLIRTLNDHLRQELETSKRALESRVGEVCPALTKVDVDEEDERGEAKVNYDKRQQLVGQSKSKTLFDIVQHVKNYAASQKEPLFYEDRDLRAFIAGLAASKLAILQGLSGTGKTSLPKVFMDALFGEREIVPVESSWRDRNELLGYYNDFNRKFTAKDFTCHLYRAGMPNYSDTPFFIILDEMNLSRVEYYFADFLSILEDNDKKNRKIKLVDVDLRSLPNELPNEVIDFIEQDGNARIKELTKKLYNKDFELQEEIIDQKEKLEIITYLSKYSLKNSELHRKLLGGPQKLINGNTIKIPENVWFIGTANRDESTFEISDKVYDRAQVLNFNKRTIGKRGTPTDSLYIPYKVLNELFDKAIQASSFDSLTNPIIEKIDKHLREKFKISFGNRITMQMDKFVKVYIAAGKTTGVSEDSLKREAIDYQLTNKVLRKLEYKQTLPDNLNELKKIFEEESLSMGLEFIEWKKQNEG